ncbi:NUDIX hydrolase [Propionibacterium freudenreichii]|uniref:NUDIX hydrolase n=2 Tax=Propionibacterium freudenreichii TaxID=1744 RepID=UPI00054423A3|nr:NUDIX hydrolase [Propionibacterium freudenreichii]AJQ90832.1 Hydrolase, NUDIX family [Propionibacterium freudenreichii subsp. freudenreichii]MCT2980566.1 NUDIX hydrolase [Propionibacterium freudenreichii]MCT3001611.1 NUDIX hydrolase [Propionibacterium freudenreichii]MCT3014540.1 NUDIX hydrolase [Propionibacterium freudenreichii]MDK9319621.1 NUDIX hydrolase [Propionibacterium freudenreichii]
MDDFKVNVVVDAGIGTLHWQGTVDQKTLDEAVSLAADDALIGHELHRVEASITADDLMAMRALHRAGFRREGRRRQAVRAEDGSWHDALLYARLIDDQVYGAGGFTAVMDTVMATHRLIGHVLIRDEHGRVLFVETTYKEDWELPGGIVEAGESPRVGAERELREELGVDIRLNQPLVADWMPPYLGWRDAMEFIFDGGQLPSSTMQRFERPAQEIRSYHWVAPEEIAEHVTPLSARRLALLVAGTAPAYTEAGSAVTPDA